MYRIQTFFGFLYIFYIYNAPKTLMQDTYQVDKSVYQVIELNKTTFTE